MGGGFFPVEARRLVHIIVGNKILKRMTRQGVEVEGLEGLHVVPAGRGLLQQPRPVWEHLEAMGIEAGALMRRLGYRAETEKLPAEELAAGWHMRAEWPAAACEDPAVHAAVAAMAIDAFVGPATMRANERDLDGDWPVMMPSLDLNCWFYAPEAQRGCDWLTVRTSVPVSRAGYAVGRTQVWAGDRLTAEGMSQVALVAVPPGEGGNA